MSMIARLPNILRLLAWQMVLLAFCAQAYGQGAAPAMVEEGPGGGGAEILGLELRREKGELQLHFLLAGKTSFEVVENFRKQVVVVKFLKARPTFKGGQTEFIFNDPFLVGIAFEQVNGGSWAKLRVRSSNLAFRVIPSTTPDRLVVSLRTAPPSPTISLTNIRLGHTGNTSRLVLDLSSIPRYDTRRDKEQFVVRLSEVTPALASALGGSDPLLEITSLKQDGKDSILTISLKRGGITVSPLVLHTPPRLAFNFRSVPVRSATTPQVTPDAQPQARMQRTDPVAEMLRAEKSPAVRAFYNQAEEDFRVGDFRKAGLGFMRTYNARPTTPLGVRAFFRAADAQFSRLQASKATTFHGLIASYQSAIRAAEAIGFESELIPMAIFRIGRSYQKMGFHFEAGVHFNILEDRFPHNQPYTVDSYYHLGNTQRSLKKLPRSIEAYQKFLELEGDPALLPLAHYFLGDSFYLLEKFTEAKQQFDIARRLNPKFPQQQPVLWFHIGETYYATAQFDDARSIYSDLLEVYPGKPYSKLVGLRLGDFLRQEGKESDALRMYERVTKDAPLMVRLRGKLRIADVLSNRATGKDYETALKLFDEVMEEGEKGAMVEEASLRRALTLMLHNQTRRAVVAFIAHSAKFPNNRFVKHGIVHAHILENLKSLVDQLFETENFWEVAKVYTEYRDPYFQDFPFNVSLFQVARAYQYLGLFDQALGIFRKIESGQPGSLKSLIAYQSALAMSEKDDLLGAEETLLNFIRANKEDTYLNDVRLELGKVYYEARRYQDALNAFQIMVQDFEKSNEPDLGEALPEAYYLLGQIHKELGQLEEAVNAFQSAPKNFHHPLQGDSVPEFIVLSQFLLGDVLFDLGRDQEAIVAYQTAVARYPEHDKMPWARFQIGLILRRGGEDRKALAIFNELVELAKTRPGELWETLAKENQRDLVNALGYQDYLKK